MTVVIGRCHCGALAVRYGEDRAGIYGKGAACTEIAVEAVISVCNQISRYSYQSTIQELEKYLRWTADRSNVIFSQARDIFRKEKRFGLLNMACRKRGRESRRADQSRRKRLIVKIAVIGFEPRPPARIAR